jgi:hypothetical protein
MPGKAATSRGAPTAIAATTTRLVNDTVVTSVLRTYDPGVFESGSHTLLTTQT